jgi:hypothetical protein
MSAGMPGGYPGDDEPISAWEHVFRARIAGSALSAGLWRHGFVEVILGPADGQYVEADSARYGTPETGWLRLVSGEQIADDAIVWATFAGTFNGAPVYDAIGGGGGGGTTITVREQDGAPTGVASVIETKQDTGLRVVQVIGGVALLGMDAASRTLWGVLTSGSTGEQVLGGVKRFYDGLIAGDKTNTNTPAPSVVIERGSTFAGNSDILASGVFEVVWDNVGTVKPTLRATARRASVGGSPLNVAGWNLSLQNQASGVQEPTFWIEQAYSGIWGDACYGIKMAAGGGTITKGATNTTGGMSFIGGLYTGGNATAGGTGFTGTIGG